MTLKTEKRNVTQMPYAFTEQGIAMLSGVLNSSIAINMNIAIMRAFVEIRRMLLNDIVLNTELLDLKKRISEHDIQLSQIYDAIENIMDENMAIPIAIGRNGKRERIGYKK